MYRIIGVVCLVFFMQGIQAQEAHSSLSLEAGYFGETLTKAGVLAAVQKGISKENDRHRIRLNVAFYKHRGYNNNLLVLPEYVFRKSQKKGRFFEISAGGGWMYQKADKTIIEFKEGVFSETNTGYSYLAPSLQFGGGKIIQNGPLSGIALSAGLRWFGQYPFNDFLMHHLALEARIGLPLEFFSDQ